jgi:hypothetical protein
MNVTMINAHEERTTRHCKNIEGKLFKGNSNVIQENVCLHVLRNFGESSLKMSTVPKHVGAE